MDREVYNTRVVSFVRKETKIEKGKVISYYVDNLTGAELNKMSCEPKIFERVDDGIYDLYDTPLTFKGTGLKLRLCYLFTDLTEEEQKKFFDRSEVITVIAKSNDKEPFKKNSKSKVKERK